MKKSLILVLVLIWQAVFLVGTVLGLRFIPLQKTFLGAHKISQATRKSDTKTQFKKTRSNQFEFEQEVDM